MENFTALEIPRSGSPIEQPLPLKRAAGAFSEQPSAGQDEPGSRGR
jgi:hypothetical protein